MAKRTFDFRITNVRCVDETEHEGFIFSGEGLANDAMRLQALFVTEDGDAHLTERRTGVFNLGSNYEDGTTIGMDRFVGRMLIDDAQPYPLTLSVALFLIEEDWFGDLSDIEGAIRGYAEATKATHGLLSSVFGAIGGAGKIASSIGKIASVVEPGIANLVLSGGNDLFTPQDVSLVIPSFDAPLDAADRRGIVDFEGHGGHYQLTYEWDVRPVGQTIALRASNGQYVAAEGGGGGPLVANRPRLREWETFELVDLGAGGVGRRVALRVHDGHFVAAEGGGGGALVANRGRARSWETFELRDLGRTPRGQRRVAFRSANGRYITAEGGGGRELVVNRPPGLLRAWEVFTLEDVD